MRIASPFSSISRLRRSANLEEVNSLLDLYPYAALYVDIHNQRILLANTRATELSTYTRSELTRMSLEELFHQLDWPSVLQDNRQDLTVTPLTLIKRNATTLEVLAHFQEVSPPGGLLLVSIEPSSDITQRKTEQQRQGHLLKELQSLSTATQMDNLDSALNLVIKTGYGLTSAPILAVYQANSQNLKLTRCAARGDDLPEQIPSKDLIHLQQPHVWEPGKRSHATLHSLARAGGFNYLATAPIGDPNATIGLLVAADKQTPAGDDILNMLQILAAMAHSVFQHFYQVDNLRDDLDQQLRFRRFAETAQNTIQDILLVLTTDFRVVKLNRSAEIALGYRDDEAQKMPVQDILIGSENLITALKMAQGGIPTLNQDNIRLYRRSGEAFLARVSILPVKNKDHVEGVIIRIQDLSEQVDAQAHTEQLEQQAILGEVTAIFAHEVRNPINSISTGLQLMAYNLKPNDPQLELISRLQQDCDRLENMMKSVLAFSRTTEYEMEPIDLGILVSRLLDRMRPRLVSASVQYHVKVDHDAPLVMGNPRALEQIFNNLFNNALQAMEETGGILAVKVQPTENTGKRQSAQVIVADNGPGIPKDILDKIFDPFFTTKATGTGLGLAITKRIVTAHKGLIQVDSFPGGTVFNVKIPALQHALDDI